MDIGYLYRPNFTTADIEQINDMFGYEFFKMPEGEYDNRGTVLSENKNPENGQETKCEEDATGENNAKGNEASKPEQDAENDDGNNEWENFFNESKDIRP